MTHTHHAVSPKHSPIAAAVGATALVTVAVLIGTYFLGGFEGLTGNGIGALIFGVFASFGLGIGLMVAVFHSSRAYDDQAHYAAMDHFKKADETKPE